MTAKTEKLSTNSQNIIHPKNPILILEDVKENQILLKELCRNMGLPSEIAENGQEGLDIIEEKTFSIFIVDLMMPVMDGKTFIKKLKQKIPNAVILIQTALDSSETIIEIMKLGVFDYIIKPLDPEVFQKVIKKSIEYKHLKDMEKDLADSAPLKIRNQLEWLNYKEDRRITAKDYAEIKSIYNLKTSLMQGKGFGSLLSIIDIILNTKKEKGADYLINKELLDLLLDNYETCNTQLNWLHEISNLLENLFVVKESDSAELIAAIPGMLTEVAPYMKNKNLKITFPELNTKCRLNLNLEKMSLIIEELIINAYKYSVTGSVINIFSYIKEAYLWICVMNEVSEKPYGGIPQKYEKLVLEPFFRVAPPDESISKVEKFSLGLGLTVVDNITRKHGGLFLIQDVRNHIDNQTKLSVLAQIMLPVVVE
ncbi:MAG: response regulator [Spirochaetes bacterium]|nr:response regulator [Spirochaetota bacterium]